MNKTHILLVEDELSIAEPLSFLLESEGFKVTSISNGNLALETFRTIRPDLILLDLMLPGMSGIDICRAIRAESDTPIIMLTAKASEIDKVVGLEIGADDYVTKPYSARELLARINSVRRRFRVLQEQPDEDEEGVLEAHQVVLDPRPHSVVVRGIEIELPLKEFELLEILMRNRGRVLTRAQLIGLVWGSDYFGDTKTLDVHIKRLRSRVEVDPGNPHMIRTVRGVGYRFD